ncbi:helix-turn-helix transcriptional regulator [Providencia sp. JGM181]|uniref:helix-turn-helix domain-containing protein n=1 Tax=unclassified Providencia TaxID=2633465 RepID=UPI001BA96DD5|nr:MULTISPECIES: helix-turn-helix transcriptional regulator [unclassified Providencia]MBS0924304.1 helix-turn-helix transcriptional regulator [Providencia sp. JGM181]MBS0932388.1 helix-turn-helix transcriptional regulator [Providencia sp. JGM172]MBS0996581.1 helix-turn-helix transcriptional regulator [Providencia sp. JGM178]
MNERKLNNLSLGQFIKEQRLARQITVTEIAKAISVSERTYSQYEDGSSSIYVAHLIALSSVLNIELQTLLDAYLNPEQ